MKLKSSMRNNQIIVPYRHEKKLTKYVAALEAAALEPMPMLASGTPQLNGASGLLLAGGTDVNPARYHAQPHPETQSPDDERDGFELEILDQAIRNHIPILAICRGLQLLNVYAGGTLRQHLASPRHNPPKDTSFAHEIEIEPGTLLASIAGQSRLPVNSYHHQAAETVGDGLRVSARDPHDGTVEALEYTDRPFVLAVQWHPEDLVFELPEQLSLFQQFAKRVHRA